MRLLLIILTLLALQPAGATRIQLLLRDEHDAGVAGATLTLRMADGHALQLTTDANGVAVSGALTGKAVWLMNGRLADGRALAADSYPRDQGFRLVLIPDQTRDALVRLDGDRLVLDPDMIFAPDQSGGPAAPTPAALAATVPPLNIGALDAAATAPQAGVQPGAITSPAQEQPGSIGLLVVVLVAGVGVVLIVVALLVGLARRRVS